MTTETYDTAYAAGKRAGGQEQARIAAEATRNLHAAQNLSRELRADRDHLARQIERIESLAEDACDCGHDTCHESVWADRITEALEGQDT